MKHNVKKWLLSGLIFLLAGAILVVVTLALSFSNSVVYKYILFPAISVFAGYLSLKLVHKIDQVQAPEVTSSSALIFSIYSTIITAIIIFITKTINILRHNMDALTIPSSQPGMASVGVSSFFGAASPIYSAIVVFLGLNLAYWIYYFKGPEKHWKDFVPHICGIIILVAVYFII